MCFENPPQISSSFPLGGRSAIMRWLITFNKGCIGTVPTLTAVVDFASVGFPLGYNQICDFPIILKVDGSVFISHDQMKTWIILFDPLAVGGIETATILWWSGARGSIPTGWQECDGFAISRATYADLFTAISTTYGVGDGSTTFNLPDLRGRAAMGVNDNTLDAEDGALSTRVVADSLGAETHVLLEAEMPSHTHNFNGTGSQQKDTSTSNNKGRDTNSNSGSAGSDGSHENMQVSFALIPIIKE